MPTATKSSSSTKTPPLSSVWDTTFKGHVVVGTGIDYDVLKRAGAANADGFVAVTDGDNRNIMAALIAQRMFNIKRIVARIYDPAARTDVPRTGRADRLSRPPWAPSSFATC